MCTVSSGRVDNLNLRLEWGVVALQCESFPCARQKSNLSALAATPFIVTEDPFALSGLGVSM